MALSCAMALMNLTPSRYTPPMQVGGAEKQMVRLEAAAKGYVELHTWGTPQQILEKLEARRALIGDFEMLLIPCYGGMPAEMAEGSMRCFAQQVLPELSSW